MVSTPPPRLCLPPHLTRLLVQARDLPPCVHSRPGYYCPRCPPLRQGLSPAARTFTSNPLLSRPRLPCICLEWQLCPYLPRSWPGLRDPKASAFHYQEGGRYLQDGGPTKAAVSTSPGSPCDRSAGKCLTTSSLETGWVVICSTHLLSAASTPPPRLTSSRQNGVTTAEPGRDAKQRTQSFRPPDTTGTANPKNTDGRETRRYD